MRQNWNSLTKTVFYIVCLMAHIKIIIITLPEQSDQILSALIFGAMGEKIYLAIDHISINVTSK